MTHSVSTLASYPDDIFWAVGVLAAAIIAVVIVGITLHRKFTHSQSNDHARPPFGLHQLRQMHQDGQLTQAEFDRAVAAMIAKQSATADPDPTTPQQQADGKK